VTQKLTLESAKSIAKTTAMSKPRTQFPYYKVQLYSARQCSWVDGRKEAFDSLEDAQAYIRQQPSGQQFRILIVEAKSRRVLSTP